MVSINILEDITLKQLNNNNMKHIYKAISGFQKEVPVIHKASTGYGYSYADLPAIFETINPLLSKHGLGFTQLINGYSLETIIFHVESGESVSSKIDIPTGVQLKGMNEFQVLGSAITYLRRYSLSAALGLVTDIDNDANDLSRGNKATASVSSVASVSNTTNLKTHANTTNTSELPWLNESSPEWSKVVDSLKNGYSINDVRKKFKVSKAIEAKLTAS